MSNRQVRKWRQAAARIPGFDPAMRRLRRTPYIEALQTRLQESHRLVGQLAGNDGTGPFLRWRPPGHFYSAIPDLAEIRAAEDRIFARPDSLRGLELREDAQLELLAKLAPYANEADFPLDPVPESRYFLRNPSYGRGDAVILQALLRYLRPPRYLEVGSGWTTALALDTNEKWLDGSMQITCIEPYPIDLRKLLRTSDQIEVIERPVQEVPLETFSSLEAGDVLFIDCSHVVKTGSDAHHLITRVLPQVRPGVYIHIHDIFWGFEYPREWVEEGRAWSEAYLLHAFLLYNQSFEIMLFNDWLTYAKHDEMARAVPALGADAGGAIWLQRVA